MNNKIKKKNIKKNIIKILLLVTAFSSFFSITHACGQPWICHPPETKEEANLRQIYYLKNKIKNIKKEINFFTNIAKVKKREDFSGSIKIYEKYTSHNPIFGNTVIHSAIIIDNSQANKDEIVLDFSKSSPQDKKAEFTFKENIYLSSAPWSKQIYQTTDHYSPKSFSIITNIKQAYKKQPIKIYTGTRIIFISSEKYSSMIIMEKIHKNQTEKNTFRIPPNEKNPPIKINVFLKDKKFPVDAELYRGFVLAKTKSSLVTYDKEKKLYKHTLTFFFNDSWKLSMLKERQIPDKKFIVFNLGINGNHAPKDSFLIYIDFSKYSDEE